MSRRALLHAFLVAVLTAGCHGSTMQSPGASSGPPPHPTILLVTLDTTRADSIGPEASEAARV